MLEIIQSEQIRMIKERLSSRGEGDFDAQLKVVKEIIQSIRNQGDEALFAYTKQFDGFDVSEKNFVVSEAEFEEAYQEVDRGLLEIIWESAENIRAFHELQKRESFFKEEEGKKPVSYTHLVLYRHEWKAL